MSSATPATGSTGSIGATALQLTATSKTVQYGISIKAAAANAGQVYVGLSSAVTANSAASTDGYELSAGESVFIPLGVASDISTLYLIASTTSQKVYWIYS